MFCLAGISVCDRVYERPMLSAPMQHPLPWSDNAVTQPAPRRQVAKLIGRLEHGDDQRVVRGLGNRVVQHPVPKFIRFGIRCRLALLYAMLHVCDLGSRRANCGKPGNLGLDHQTELHKFGRTGCLANRNQPPNGLDGPTASEGPATDMPPDLSLRLEDVEDSPKGASADSQLSTELPLRRQPASCAEPAAFHHPKQLRLGTLYLHDPRAIQFIRGNRRICAFLHSYKTPNVYLSLRPVGS